MTLSQDQKLIELVSKKLTSDENLLTIEQIYFYPTKPPNAKRLQDYLIITTANVFFVYNFQIKRILPITHINYITLAILGNEIIIHAKQDWIRIQSSATVNIIGNLLHSKQKFQNEKDPFTIHLQIQHTLEKFMSESINQKRSFWNIFKKSSDQETKSSLRRTSFCTIQVNEKNFLLEIGKKVYKAIFINSDLLHISGEATGFRFNSETYEYKDLNQTDTIYWKVITSEERSDIKYLRRKIDKLSRYETDLVRRNLSNYKFNNYSQHILFAVEVDTHFEIIISLDKDSKFSSQILDNHLELERSLINSNKDIKLERHAFKEQVLKSIFYKLNLFIEQQSHKKNILCSLSPEVIYMGKDDIKISTVLSKLLSRININYLAPQELESLPMRLQKIEKNIFDQKDSDINSTKESFKEDEGFSESQVHKINLWKVGILLYELSYCKIPFPIEYIAYKVSRGEAIKINFPDKQARSIQFRHFIKSLLCKDPETRGMRTKGETRQSILNPGINNIMEHQWITKKRE